MLFKTCNDAIAVDYGLLRGGGGGGGSKGEGRSSTRGKGDFRKHRRGKLTVLAGSLSLEVLLEVVLRNSAACAFLGHPLESTRGSASLPACINHMFHCLLQERKGKERRGEERRGEERRGEERRGEERRVYAIRHHTKSKPVIACCITVRTVSMTATCFSWTCNHNVQHMLLHTCESHSTCPYTGTMAAMLHLIDNQ